MSEGSRVTLDLTKTCRTCLVQKSTEELWSLLENNLDKVLCEIANIEVHFHTPLPTTICTGCLKLLNTAVKFRNQVRDAETQLKNIIYPSDEAECVSPMTVVYKSFAVLDSTGFSGDYEGRRDNLREKQCEKFVIIESIEKDQSKFQNLAKNKMYAINEETKEDSEITCFVSDDDENNFSETLEKKELHTLNRGAIVINGNVSNVIKWADSETNSLLSSNNLDNDKRETISQEAILEEQGRLKVTVDDADGKTEAENVESNNTKKASTFNCNLCTKKFRYEFVYKTHLLQHGIPLICNMCKAAFNDSKTYLAHIKSIHPGFKPFSCPYCDKNFSAMSTLKKHCIFHTASARIRKFICDICGKRFSRQNYLATHKRSHSSTRSHQCDTCNKKFSGAHSLRNHLKIHKGEKNHKCDICNAEFIHRFSLRAHLRTHSGEKPFVCKICGNKFSRSSYLKIHLRTHTSEKPYRCIWCEKNFVSRCALAAHEKSHTGEKKFQCDVCGSRSTRLADLRTHIRTHTGEKPYFCNQCDKSYKTSSNLAAHKKTHLGLKEHVCHICSRAFGDPRTLKSHIRVHTGETPYQCHICGNRFRQAGQLSAHKRTHQN